MKKILVLYVFCACVVCLYKPNTVLAADETDLIWEQNVINSEEVKRNISMEEDDKGLKNLNGYYVWKITSKTVVGYPYGN